MEWIKELLMWALPSGFLGALFSWLVNRKVSKAQRLRDEQFVYRDLYNDLKQTLEEFGDENRRLYEVVSKLEKALSFISRCKYADNCPVTDELRKQKKGRDNSKTSRQHQNTREGEGNDNESAGEQSEGATDDESAGEAPAGGKHRKQVAAG